MKTAAAVLSVLACAVSFSPAGEEVLKEISWSRLKQDGALISGEVIPADAETTFERLKVTNTTQAMATIPLLELKDPGIARPFYVLSGKVRYENVTGRGYLEMWSHFPDGRAYFTRTLAETGPMQRIEGTSEWRPFALPFNLGEQKRFPTKLVINLVLPPGEGVVHLSPLTLTQAHGPSTRWGFSVRQTTTHVITPLGCGILGVVFGVVMGIAGTLVGLGRGRRFVTVVLVLCIAAGAVLLVLGIAAAGSVPYSLYYPMILVGAIALVISGIMLPLSRLRYRQAELRRMQALDVA